MQMYSEFKNPHFSCIFFNMDISLIIALISLKICMCISGICMEGSVSQNLELGLKPIFHQNVKSFALGTFASPNAKDSTFALPNARNTNMLVSFALGDANFLRWPCTFHFFVYISFASGSQREPHLHRNIGGVGSSGVGHVHFMYISCCLCIIFRVGYAKISQRRGKFQWNMGFSFCFIVCRRSILKKITKNHKSYPFFYHKEKTRT